MVAAKSPSTYISVLYSREWSWTRPDYIVDRLACLFILGEVKHQRYYRLLRVVARRTSQLHHRTRSNVANQSFGKTENGPVQPAHLQNN
jgi:hypothetical protein